MLAPNSREQHPRRARSRHALAVAGGLILLVTSSAVLLTQLTTMRTNAIWEQFCSIAGSYKRGSTILFGDSILAEISMPRRFGIAPVKNRSVSGRLATLSYNDFTKSIGPDTRAVIILLGTNDLGKEIAQGDIVDSLKKMASYATSKHIRVGICSILPTAGRHAAVRAGRTLVTNELLKAACKEDGNTYIDLYDMFADPKGTLDKSLSRDGLHLNEKGRTLLSSLLRETIRSNAMQGNQ